MLSPNPVADLLHGHSDPEVRRFVTKYLRFPEDKREDIKADMEGEKFARMTELDTAAIYGAEAQGEGIAGPSHYAGQVAAVEARPSALVSARIHSLKLLALHNKSERPRVTMRELNRFLTEVMEGEKCPGQEVFSDFLISLGAVYSALPEGFAETLELYIKVSYGDPGISRTIPFALARAQGLFSKDVAALTFQAEKKTKEERRKFQTRYIPEEEQARADSRRRDRGQEVNDRQRAMGGKITSARMRSSWIGEGRTGRRTL